MELHHMTTPSTPPPPKVLLAGKIMVMVFSDENGVILANFLAGGTTVNSNHYTETVRSGNARLHRVCPTRKISKCCSSVTMLGHTRVHTTDAIKNFGWKVLPHPPNSPDLTPLDYHLFGLLTRSLWGHLYAKDEALPVATQEGQHLLPGWNTCSCSKMKQECLQRWRLLKKDSAFCNAVVKFCHSMLITNGAKVILFKILMQKCIK
jgi:hypothetical protein